MKRALIIGGAGFVGKYLAEHLCRDMGYEVICTKLPQETENCNLASWVDLDILDHAPLEAALKRLAPDCIFHLAAQSSVALSWKNPALTVDVNVKGTVNVLEAVRKMEAAQLEAAGKMEHVQPEAMGKMGSAQPEAMGKMCRGLPEAAGGTCGSPKVRVLLVGSAEEYGPVKREENPISEDHPVHPANCYAATKACQNMLGAVYAAGYGMHVMMTRSFNHAGPGQAPGFVVPDFCRQVAEIEAGKREPVIRVGNLSARRDFTDVRDVVRAYGLLMEHGEKGQTYNVGSGRTVEIRRILEEIVDLSSAKIEIAVDPVKMRPVDVPEIAADIGKLQAATDWEPQIALKETLRDCLESWREKV